MPMPEGILRAAADHSVQTLTIDFDPRLLSDESAHHVAEQLAPAARRPV